MSDQDPYVTLNEGTTAHPDRFRISALPADSRHYQNCLVYVENRGPGKWAVTQDPDMRLCLSVDGEWDFEPPSSERDDEWLQAHRFDLNTALALAARASLEMATEAALDDQ